MSSPARGDAYRRDGFVLAQGLFSRAEVEVLRREGVDVIDRLAKRHDTDGAWRTAGDTPSTKLHHCHDLQLHSALFSRTLFDERLTSTFAELMGTPNVQLHHNKFFIKPRSVGSRFPLHQDWPFFPHAHDSLMAAIVHLDDAPVEKGPVHVVPGSHRDGRRDHDGEPHWHLIEEPATPPLTIEAAAGDVLFFHCHTVHGSAVNSSDSDRTTWLIQVRDPADTPTVDRHRSPGQGTMLAGVNDVRPPAPSSFT